MPFDAIGTYACRALQDDYVAHFGKNAAVNKTMGSTSLIKWLLSPQNTRGFKQINVESIPGKKRTVAFLYDEPFCFDVFNPAVTCETVKTAITNPSKEVVFELDGDPFRVATGDDGDEPGVLTFNEDDLMKYCTKDNTSYISEQIIRFLIRYEEALDKALCALLNAAVGTDADGNAIVSLPFFVTNNATGTSVLNSDAMFWLDQKYRDIGGEDMYGLIGGKVVNKMIALNKWAGLNQAGIDLKKVGDDMPYPYYNRNLDGITGIDTFFQLSPGAVQLVTWNKYKGERRRQVTDLYSKNTIISPRTGLAIDWKWWYDYDCEIWKFEPSLHAELAVNRPGGCGLPTSNGLLKFKDCSGGSVVPACPEQPVE